MNKLIIILIVAVALGAYAERPPVPGAYRYNAEALCEKRPHAMKVEVLTKTGHAESEKVAYAKPDVWKWLFR